MGILRKSILACVTHVDGDRPSRSTCRPWLREKFCPTVLADSEPSFGHATNCRKPRGSLPVRTGRKLEGHKDSSPPIGSPLTIAQTAVRKLRHEIGEFMLPQVNPLSRRSRDKREFPSALRKLSKNHFATLSPLLKMRVDANVCISMRLVLALSRAGENTSETVSARTAS